MPRLAVRVPRYGLIARRCSGLGAVCLFCIYVDGARPAKRRKQRTVLELVHLRCWHQPKSQAGSASACHVSRASPAVSSGWRRALLRTSSGDRSLGLDLGSLPPSFRTPRHGENERTGCALHRCCACLGLGLAQLLPGPAPLILHSGAGSIG